jgi:hypothetical protein
MSRLLVCIISLILFGVYWIAMKRCQLRQDLEEYYSAGQGSGIMAIDGDMDTGDLPPLNYFTLSEPDYFFYDPEVAGSYDKSSSNMKRFPGDTSTNIADIFGPDNYTRYYLDTV